MDSMTEHREWIAFLIVGLIAFSIWLGGWMERRFGQ